MFKRITSAAFLVILMLCAVSCQAQTDCKNFTLNIADNAGDVHTWKIVYNKFYKKYAIADTDSSGKLLIVLAKDHTGDFGIYSPEGMDNTNCIGCIDPSKSWFSTTCQAKEFLLLYARKKKQDKWQ